MNDQHFSPEFSRPLIVARLGVRPILETLEATPDERHRLAARLNLVAIDRLSAVIDVKKQPMSELIQVSGRIEADVVQSCVLTLAEFPSHIEDSFELTFSPAAKASDVTVDVDPDIDPPEPIENGVIDLGELSAQYLSLALDPYPHAPGAELAPINETEDAPAASPFESLRRLKLS